MYNAMIISQSASKTTIVHSDMVAAKLMQQAIKDGRGEGLLGAAGEKRTEAQGRVEPKRVEQGERTEKARDVRGGREADRPREAGRSGEVMSLREKVGEMTRALEALTEAFNAMSNYKMLVMESDSATAIAFAGSVLSNVEMDAEAAEAGTVEGGDAGTQDAVSADGRVVSRISTGEGDDAIGVNGEIARHIDGGSGGDGIAIEARKVVHVRGGSGDDMIAVDAMQAWGVSGGSGNDKMHVLAERVGRVSGGDGDDTMAIQGMRINKVDGGSGDDTMAITGHDVSNVTDGQGDDVVTIHADKLSNLQSSEGDDVYNLNVGRATMSLRQGMGNDTVNLVSGSHLQFSVGDSDMMGKGAMTAVWEGEDLNLTFGNGDTLTINNAANSGSISMRSGNTVMTLMQPSVPGGTGILDLTI